MTLKTKILHRLTALGLASLVGFLTVLPSFAQSAPVAADPLITEMIATNANPSPGASTAIQVFYENRGTEAARNVNVVIDYDETSLAPSGIEPAHRCVDNGTEALCVIPVVNAGERGELVLSARMLPTLAIGTEVRVNAQLTADNDANPSNNDGSVPLNISAFGTGTLGITELIGPDGVPLNTGATLDAPATHQGIAVFNVANDPNWVQSVPLTTALKFLIRGKEALAWTLEMSESGVSTSGVQGSYHQVLTVVNSLFIIGLLVIAGMWMFSLFIPRHTLRQVILVFAAAVIFVNFSLPLTRLVIDGSNLLQQTFLGDTNIADVVETPLYHTSESTVYQNQNQLENGVNEVDVNVQSLSEDGVPPVVARIESNATTPSYTGTVTGSTGGATVQESIQLQSTGNPLTVQLNPDAALKVLTSSSFDPLSEQVWFVAGLVGMTGVAYFLIAGVFLLRMVVLWILLVVSPILFLLVIFKSTRQAFYEWLTLYGRWILIGPFLALGISFVVSIWENIGLPFTSQYNGNAEFGLISNIGFYLPGSDRINHLSTTTEMMQYLTFLMMLFAPVLMAFLLTRTRWIQAAINPVIQALPTPQSSTATARISEKTTEKTTETIESQVGVRGFLSNQLSKLTGTQVPGAERLSGLSNKPIVEGASSLLPQQLALSSVNDLLGLASGSPESRHKRDHAVERMAQISTLPAGPERQKTEAVYRELNERAERGDPAAIEIMNEVKAAEVNVQTSTEPTSESTVQPNVHVEPVVNVEATVDRESLAQIPDPTPKAGRNDTKDIQAIEEKVDELTDDEITNDQEPMSKQ